MVSSFASRAAQALLLLALGCLVAAPWLTRASDALVVTGATALLVAPWLSLLTPVEAGKVRWPWIVALLGLVAVSFLI